MCRFTCDQVFRLALLNSFTPLLLLLLPLLYFHQQSSLSPNSPPCHWGWMWISPLLFLSVVFFLTYFYLISCLRRDIIGRHFVAVVVVEAAADVTSLVVDCCLLFLSLLYFTWTVSQQSHAIVAVFLVILIYLISILILFPLRVTCAWFICFLFLSLLFVAFIFLLLLFFLSFSLLWALSVWMWVTVDDSIWEQIQLSSTLIPLNTCLVTVWLFILTHSLSFFSLRLFSALYFHCCVDSVNESAQLLPHHYHWCCCFCFWSLVTSDAHDFLSPLYSSSPSQWQMCDPLLASL